VNAIYDTTTIWILGVAFCCTMFILCFMRKTSEYMTRARFRTSVWITIALFLLLAVLFVRHRSREPERIRIGILPVHDISYDEELAWVPWAITARAVRCLQTQLPSSYLVCRPEWIWQAVDRDSLADINYLQSFAERLHLDYALLASLSFAEGSYTLQYLFVRVSSPNILQKSQLQSAEDQPQRLGETLAGEVMRLLNRPVHEMPCDADSVATKPLSLAELGLAQRDEERAIFWARQAFLQDSVSARVRNVLAAALLESSILKEKNGERDTDRLEALRLCERSVLNHKNANAMTYRLLGTYYILEKMWGKAQGHLAKAIELDPDDAAAFSLYGYLNDARMEKIGYSNEKELLQHILYLNPCDESVRLRLADIEYSANRIAASRTEIEALLRIHPRSLDGLMFLGKLAASQRDFLTLTNIYEQIFAIDPSNADAYYNLGIYYFQIEDWANAEKLFNRAVRLGNHLDSHLYLGQIYEHQGKTEKAIEEYRLRIHQKHGMNDRYADVAMQRLYSLLKPDSTLIPSHAP
jgi:tetratricopeptide (TPR) repeat protein